MFTLVIGVLYVVILYLKIFIEFSKTIFTGRTRAVQNLKRWKGKEGKELTPWIKETVSALFSKQRSKTPTWMFFIIILIMVLITLKYYLYILYLKNYHSFPKLLKDTKKVFWRVLESSLQLLTISYEKRRKQIKTSFLIGHGISEKQS